MTARNQRPLLLAGQLAHFDRRALPLGKHDLTERRGPLRIDRPETIRSVDLIDGNGKDVADLFGFTSDAWGVRDCLGRHSICPSDLDGARAVACRSEEHTSDLQSLMRNSYAVFCLKKTTALR